MCFHQKLAEWLSKKHLFISQQVGVPIIVS